VINDIRATVFELHATGPALQVARRYSSGRP
jgi:hypothetical protein